MSEIGIVRQLPSVNLGGRSGHLIQEVSNETHTNEITGYNVLPKLTRFLVTADHAAKAHPRFSGARRNYAHGQGDDPKNQENIWCP
jgi:hypothetical protein